MGLDIDFKEGQTPLDEDEKEGLLISPITTRSELDEFEQMNIEKAIEWTMKRKFKKEQIFTEEFVRNLHHKMYGDVWKWAGEFRKTEKNIGIDPHQIGIALKQLLEDCIFWIANKTFPDEEIAIRFKHSLVKIHCFTNGNGRHSRLMADIIINHVFGKPVFSWGQKSFIKKGAARNNYLLALKDADNGDIKSLLEFARK